MPIDGLKRVGSARVSLDEFFDRPAFAEVRIIGPYAKALIREVVMGGFDIGAVDGKGRTAEVQTKTEGMALREMQVRNLKLQHGVVANNITIDGANATWDERLWKELDEADPRILEKVIAAIDAPEGIANPI